MEERKKILEVEHLQKYFKVNTGTFRKENV